MKRPISLLAALWACQLLQAHQQPTTLMLLDIGTQRVGMELHIPLPELELAFGHHVAESPETNIATWGPALRRYLTNHMHATSATAPDPWKIRVLQMSVERTEQKQSGPFQEALVSLELIPPPGVSPRDFTLDYDAILHQVVTHKVIVSIRNDWETGASAARPRQIGMIQVDTETARIQPLKLQLGQGSQWTGFLGMVTLGIDHIREGTDHLLFLMTLLLPASLVIRGNKWAEFGGVRYGLLRVLKVVTAFTVGHSITLLAGALEWVKIPQQPVEILIAVSILVSAIHAIRPIFPAKEAYFAAGFGLVHGMGFASGLTELHLDPAALALSIFGFNLGIEAMQLFVIALTMPWFLLLSQTSVSNWARIGGAAMASIAAIGWIANRISGEPNSIEQLLAAASQFSVYGIPALALIAIPAFVLTQPVSE